MADTLVKEKTIRIGMVRCSMEPRIQCPRGHTNISHKDVHVDRSKLCFACGEEGHTAKGCEKETSCPICQKSGHRAGSGKCEAFKRLLFEDRKQFKKLLYQNKNMQREESDMGITQMETNWWKRTNTIFHYLYSSKFYFIINITGTCEEFGKLLEDIEDCLKENRKHSVIATDFNAKTAIIGSPVTNLRGKILEEWMAKTDLAVINHGKTPTFSGPQGTSFIDVTLAPTNIAGQIKN
ncbi:hypothetical protein D910_02089 [Dendroctonus ponderosae]|uniref:CCHC-type domain-containing protein n=1 Tax=Dendroctonus ponderosae TaxID=77166 RepID=U4TV40_DENPD|nr:hypothetical protein D910_02089 [Dendroctonus ponderosae]